MLKISKFFTIIFILISFIAKSLGETGILFRLTPPDVFGGLAIIFFIFSQRPIKIFQHKPILFLILLLFIGGVFGLSFTRSFFEIIILVFLLVMFYLITYHFRTENGFKQLILTIAWASLLASFFGVYDMAAEMTGLPRVFEGRARGEVVSGFRNAGQAGAYALVMLSILIPVQSSLLINSFTFKQIQLIRYSLISMIVFFMLTGKIAAYIGFAFGLTLFFFYIRNSKALLTTIIFSALFYLLYTNLDVIAPEVAWRITGKYNSRVATKISGESGLADEDTFIGRNIREVFEAFEDNPIIGSGIGGFSLKYSTHEVHSTYFKMIGEGGMLGVIGYIVFLFYFFKYFRSKSAGQTYNDILFYMYPFILGCFVSWSYTYHLRKREFWILFAFIVIINNLILIRKRNSLLNEK